MRIIALEGPSCVGKTTVIGALAADASLGRVAVFDCYVREIARPGDVPPARTTSRAQQIAAFRTFMDIEERRVLRAQRLAADQDPPDLIILDRSVDTLLAHAHALDVLYGFGAYPAAAALLSQLPHLAPESTIYLDASAAVLRARRSQAEGGSGQFFLHDVGFLAAWRDYFFGYTGSTVAAVVSVIAADAAAAQVAAHVRELL